MSAMASVDEAWCVEQQTSIPGVGGEAMWFDTCSRAVVQA
jgi:hypothetical protein